jgi:hypothetical protein
LRLVGLMNLVVSSFFREHSLKEVFSQSSVLKLKQKWVRNYCIERVGRVARMNFMVGLLTGFAATGPPCSFASTTSCMPDDFEVLLS